MLTISAAAVVDCISWCLLALVVSIINATQPINALYIFLIGVGFTIFMMICVRPLLIRYLRYTNSFENGPSQWIMVIIFLLVFVSAFFTDIIGIHPIFGGFIVGVIIPHDNGFAVKIAEKVEDLVHIIFLPIVSSNLSELHIVMTHQTSLPIHFSICLLSSPVLCPLWPEDQLGIVEFRSGLGLSFGSYLCCLQWKDHRVYGCCSCIKSSLA